MVLVDAQRLAQCGRFDEMLAICRGMLDASDANVATLLDIGALLYGYENRGLSPISLLANATPEQRNHWQLAGGGYGIHWPDIDEDLSTEGLLRGARAPQAGLRS